MEYLVRAARVTDIDRLVALSDERRADDRADSPLGAADLMRQLVYLPQASIVVAETQRVVVGGAVLALRPSVRAGGYVGTIDLLVVDPEHDADRITEALLEELHQVGQQQGLHRRRGRTAGRRGRPTPAGSGWVSAKPVRASNES